MRKLVLGVVVVALLVTAVVLVRGLVERAGRSSFEEALRMVPAATQRVGFTDWAAARRITGIARTADPAEIDRLVDESYDRDLSAASVMTGGADAQQELLGFSAGTVAWEAFAQSPEGSALVVRLADEVDTDDVRAALAASGYDKPASDDGVWQGGIDLVAGLDPDLGQQFQHVAVLDDQHAVVASDEVPHVERAARAARGDGESLAEADDTDGLSGSVGEPVVSAVLWSRDFACEDLALSRGAPEDEQRGAAVIEAAGGVSPLDGLLMARLAGSSLVVVERYEEERQARADLAARARLAVGEAVGRAGSYADDFELTASRTDGANVVLMLRAREGNSFLLSALSNGPVVFAAC